MRDAALMPMRELHRQIQQPVNLSVRQGDEIVYVERAYSERSGMQVVRAIGGRAPLHLTSTGKLFLAADDPQRVRAYATRTGLTGHTRNSITQLPVLERELAKARQYGIARDNEELELGVRCMAAGIYDDQGRLVAGLSISAPADRLDEDWLAKLQATANEISAALGYKPPRSNGPPDAAALAKGHGAKGAVFPGPACRTLRRGLPAHLTGSPADCDAWVRAARFDSTQRRTRSASPMRLSLPAESRNTMISLRPATLACITRHWPASEM